MTKFQPSNSEVAFTFDLIPSVTPSSHTLLFDSQSLKEVLDYDKLFVRTFLPV